MKPLLPPPRIWRMRVSHYRLVGGRCSDCGFIFFPYRPRCPRCGSRRVEEHVLPRRGRIESYTVVYQVPEHMREYAPLAYAVIRLEDGTRIVGALTEADPGRLNVGAEVEAVLRRVAVDGEYGIIAYGTKWRPLRATTSGETHRKEQQ